MSYVFLVEAHDGRGVQGDMLIASYDNRQGAADHARFINEVDNEFTASVKFMYLHTSFAEKNDRGIRDIKYFEG